METGAEKNNGYGMQKVELRIINNQAFVTDNGHYILDCYFEKIDDADALNISLHLIPGVWKPGFLLIWRIPLLSDMLMEGLK